MKDFGDGPLSGIRILDLTAVIMGPHATRILGDFGADVIKIEPPGGDVSRHYRPARNPGMAGDFLNLNRNKRSVVLDLKTPAGMDAFRRLLHGAHGVVHNLRPQVARRLKMDYETLREVRPDIVYCATFGFGSAGPYSARPAYDDLIQAGSGLADIHRLRSGEPAYVPSAIFDKLVGQAVATAMLAGLMQQARGGGGQAIEVPMLETAVAFNLVDHLGGRAFDPPAGPMGFRRTLSQERRPYPTRDGHVCIMPYSDAQWDAFYDFVGRPEFKDDPRFVSLPMRIPNIDVLYRLIAEETPERTTAEWLEFCEGAGIPCMQVVPLDELEHDPHLAAAGLLKVEEHPTEGRYMAVGRPEIFSAVPFRIRRHAPRLGEHSAEVLREAGLGDAEIERMIEQGVTSVP